MSIITKVLYKDLQRCQVEEIPDGLSRATILETFHNHDLMIRSIYPGSHIKESTSISSSSTKFSSLNPKSNVTTVCTLTSLEDGIGMVTDLGLWMEINCRWTVHDRVESPPLGGDKALTRNVARIGSLYLLEEAAFHIIRPFERFARNDRQQSHAMEGILRLLQRLKSGEVSAVGLTAGDESDVDNIVEDAKPKRE
ncbi:hypothetical protein ABOM_002821 [Aspergillus bombycis]|uniref:Uncharacterized protein n=1 Tax=Aspergillus bombycis TaxID=109264 RepID=A0A1F8A9Q7_9EURO|nr:hypothetical protein ABOM_002821 [Aspergillus bombycis]OGM48038.1 hypothetical protein ABOM_002821 [Aspergillus bombycis]